MNLSHKIDRVSNITREEFELKYLKPQKPVIIKNFFGENAALYHKWTYDYFIQTIGETPVGIYDTESTERKEDRSYKSADATMPFGDYLRLIQQGPTTKRIFLFNIFKHLPELRNDFDFPKITSRYLKRVPFVFFGGKNAVTRLHYDMDNSNVFLTEITGKKRVVLFHPKYSKHLYRFPFGVHSSVDPLNPDFEKYPAMQYAEGLDVVLEKGETLFMPCGYWHHIVYEESSFGLAIRSIGPKSRQVLRGALNVGILTHTDEVMRFLFKDRWFQYKVRTAQKRGQRIVETHKNEENKRGSERFTSLARNT